MHAQTPPERLVFLSCVAAMLGLLGGEAAWVLLHLIGLITNLALFHRFGWELPPTSALRAGPWIPVAAMAGALLVSCLAKWSPVIRGHGIPEAMEAVLVRQSRIAPRAALAKPLSAAIAIGTGGPFGAEGPIIVTGGALGSLLGLVCGLLAVVVSEGLFAVEAMFRRLPVSDFWHPVIGAAAFSAVGLLAPRALGVGYDAIGDVLNDRMALGAIAVLAVAKLVAWWLALGSGTSGGTLAPLLLIGGSFGSLFGMAARVVWPGLPLAPGAFAVVAMAALFGASTRATFTAIVFLFELTRDYRIILPLMLAAVVADLVAAALLRESLMTEKLARRGLRVHAEYEVDLLRTTMVRSVMTTRVETVPAEATVGEVCSQVSAGRHSAYPVVDDGGRCVGIVARGDLLRRPVGDSAPVLEVASRDVVTLAPDDTVFVALRRILEESVEHLPVIEDGRLVGICTRTDVLRARRPQLDHERPQPGWRLGNLRS